MTVTRTNSRLILECGHAITLGKAPPEHDPIGCTAHCRECAGKTVEVVAVQPPTTPHPLFAGIRR